MGGFVLEGTHKHHGKILPCGGRSQAEALKASLPYQDVCLASQCLDLFLRKGNADKGVQASCPGSQGYVQ